MNSLRLAARTLAGLIAVFLAVAPVLDGLHDLEVRHEWCEAHRHLVHVLPSSAEVERTASVVDSLQSDARPFAGESDCLSWLMRVPLARDFGEHDLQEFVEGEPTLRSAGSARPFTVLARAPKRGPPLT